MILLLVLMNDGPRSHLRVILPPFSNYRPSERSSFVVYSTVLLPTLLSVRQNWSGSMVTEPRRHASSHKACVAHDDTGVCRSGEDDAQHMHKNQLVGSQWSDDAELGRAP